MSNIRTDQTELAGVERIVSVYEHLLCDGPVLRGEGGELNKDASCQCGAAEICAKLQLHLAYCELQNVFLDEERIKIDACYIRSVDSNSGVFRKVILL